MQIRWISLQTQREGMVAAGFMLERRIDLRFGEAPIPVRSHDFSGLFSDSLAVFQLAYA